MSQVRAFMNRYFHVAGYVNLSPQMAEELQRAKENDARLDYEAIYGKPAPGYTEMHPFWSHDAERPQRDSRTDAALYGQY